MASRKISCAYPKRLRLPFTDRHTPLVAALAYLSPRPMAELHMKVEQVMTPSPATCGTTDNLAQAVERMWDANCGIIPIVDDAGHVISVVTDRDICIAAATRGRAPGDIRVDEMESRPVVTCRLDDELKTALTAMKEHRVRRVPVTSDEGVLHGIISLDDIASAAGTRNSVSAVEVIAAMKAIYAPPLPAAPRAA
jgi:CBS domain-containing protein